MTRIDRKLEQKANSILVKNDMLTVPVDLITIANNHDIEVYHDRLPKGISGSIKYNGEKFQIVIDETESLVKQRFTLAHELAHYFLEGDKLLRNQEVHFDRHDKNSGEEDIDYLAGALLMDRDMVTKLYQVCPSVTKLAKTFNVSHSAMTMRLIRLGLM